MLPFESGLVLPLMLVLVLLLLIIIDLSQIRVIRVIRGQIFVLSVSSVPSC
jgi:hypothetical protein